VTYEVPTVKIKHLKTYLIINASDYNEKIHQLYEEWIDKESQELIPPQQEEPAFTKKSDLIQYVKDQFGIILDKRKSFVKLSQELEELRKKS
jgi:hypothetical protein